VLIAGAGPHRSPALSPGERIPRGDRSRFEPLNPLTRPEGPLSPSEGQRRMVLEARFMGRRPVQAKSGQFKPAQPRRSRDSKQACRRPRGTRYHPGQSAWNARPIRAAAASSPPCSFRARRTWAGRFRPGI
jgi:hypothetical protein